jgi:hypothetical protein
MIPTDITNMKKIKINLKTNQNNEELVNENKVILES